MRIILSSHGEYISAAPCCLPPATAAKLESTRKRWTEIIGPTSWRQKIVIITRCQTNHAIMHNIDALLKLTSESPHGGAGLYFQPPSPWPKLRHLSPPSWMEIIGPTLCQQIVIIIMLSDKSCNKAHCIASTHQRNATDNTCPKWWAYIMSVNIINMVSNSVVDTLKSCVAVPAPCSKHRWKSEAACST